MRFFSLSFTLTLFHYITDLLVLERGCTRETGTVRSRFKIIYMCVYIYILKKRKTMHEFAMFVYIKIYLLYPIVTTQYDRLGIGTCYSVNKTH